MFITSHKIRRPIANILGISNVIEEFVNSRAKLNELVNYLKESARSLDDFTKELTIFIVDLEKKGNPMIWQELL